MNNSQANVEPKPVKPDPAWQSLQEPVPQSIPVLLLFVQLPLRGLGPLPQLLLRAHGGLVQEVPQADHIARTSLELLPSVGHESSLRASVRANRTAHNPQQNAVKNMQV